MSFQFKMLFLQVLLWVYLIPFWIVIYCFLLLPGCFCGGMFIVQMWLFLFLCVWFFFVMSLYWFFFSCSFLLICSCFQIFNSLLPFPICTGMLSVVSLSELFFLSVGWFMCLLIFWFSLCCKILNFSSCMFFLFTIHLLKATPPCVFWYFFLFIYTPVVCHTFWMYGLMLFITLKNFHLLSPQIFLLHHFLSISIWTPVYIFVDFPPFIPLCLMFFIKIY